MRFSDFCRAIALSSFRSTGYLVRIIDSRKVPDRYHRVRFNRLRDHPVANTHDTTDTFWASRLEGPPTRCICLAACRSSAAHPQENRFSGSTPLSRRCRVPCLVGVGFPVSGPRVWTFTSCLLTMPVAPRRLALQWRVRCVPGTSARTHFNIRR